MEARRQRSRRTGIVVGGGIGRVAIQRRPLTRHRRGIVVGRLVFPRITRIHDLGSGNTNPILVVAIEIREVPETEAEVVHIAQIHGADIRRNALIRARRIGRKAQQQRIPAALQVKFVGLVPVPANLIVFVGTILLLVDGADKLELALRILEDGDIAGICAVLQIHVHKQREIIRRDIGRDAFQVELHAVNGRLEAAGISTGTIHFHHSRQFFIRRLLHSGRFFLGRHHCRARHGQRQRHQCRQKTSQQTLRSFHSGIHPFSSFMWHHRRKMSFALSMHTIFRISLFNLFVHCVN